MRYIFFSYSIPTTIPFLRRRHAPEDLEHLQNSIKGLESDPKYISAWSPVSTDDKNDLLNEHYRNLAEDLLFNVLTDGKPVEKPKANKRTNMTSMKPQVVSGETTE